ncbi:MAG: hypothetical protein M1457_11825 [bacterium]|nr:hypothetical protein [bacterium]
MKTIHCPYCNEQVSNITVRCPHCGKTITGEAEGSSKYVAGAKVSASRSGGIRKLFWFVLVLVVVAGAVYLLVLR